MIETSEQDDPSWHLPFLDLSRVSFMGFITTQKKRNDLDPLYLTNLFA